MVDLTDALPLLAADGGLAAKAIGAALTVVAAVAGGTWWFSSRIYEGRIESAKASAALAKEQAEEYRRKLDGRTPDEAEAEIAALKEAVAAIAKRLDDDAKVSFHDRVRQVLGPATLSGGPAGLATYIRGGPGSSGQGGM